MTALIAREPKPDHIVIETSGLALPKPLIKAFDWPELRTKLTVDGVVAVVDAAAVAEGRFADDPARVAEQRASDPSLDHDNPLEEVYEDQLLSADLVVLNKADLVGPDRLNALRAEIAGALPRAVKIAPAREGAIDADVLLGMRAAAEDDLAARPSHHDAEGEHDHDDFDTFVVADSGGSRSRRASSSASSRRRARMTSCASRASSKSPASRCGCWCRGSGGASGATSTGRGARPRRVEPPRRDRPEGRRPRRGRRGARRVTG